MHQMKMLSPGQIFIFLAILGASAPLVTGQNPGVVVGITEDGLDDIARVGCQYLQCSLSRITIPNFSYGRYAISDIRIASLKVSNCSIRTSPCGLKPNITISLTVTFKFRYCRGSGWFRFCDDGTVTIRGKFIQIIEINVGVTSGHYSFRICDCKLSILDFNPRVTGSWLSGVYNFLIGILFKSYLKSLLEAQICPLLKKALVAEATDVINSFKKTQKVSKDLCIDYSLVDSIATGSTYAASKLKGKFCPCGSQSTQPPLVQKLSKGFSLVPRALSVSPEPIATCPYYIRGSDYVINTAFDTYYRSGALQQSFCLPLPPDINQIARLVLTGSGSKCSTPTVASSAGFPENCSFAINLKTNCPPTVTITKRGITFTFGFIVELLTSSNCSQCTINGTATAIGSVGINTTSEGHNITGNLHAFNVSLHDNDLCPLLTSFPVLVMLHQMRFQSLAAAFNRVAEDLVKPQLNERLAVGFPIPELKNLNLTDPTIHFNDGYVTICFNLNFQTVC